MTARTRLVRSTAMSRKEQETLELLAQGFSPAEIADALQVTTNYIYAIIRLLKARFDARTTTGIVVRALREGVIEGDESAWEDA